MIRAVWPCRTTTRGVGDLGTLVTTLPDPVRRALVIDVEGRWSLGGGWTNDLGAALEPSAELHELISRTHHPAGMTVG